jgi:hypothetical protein
MPAALPHSTRSRSSAWLTTHPTPQRRPRWCEEANASTGDGWMLRGSQRISPKRIRGPSAEKKQDPGSLQGPGPDHTAPRSPLRNRHLLPLGVNRQHQTGRSGKGTTFGGRGLGDVLSDSAVTRLGAPRGFGPPGLTGAPSGLPLRVECSARTRRLQTDRACSRWRPRRSRQLPTDTKDRTDDQASQAAPRAESLARPRAECTGHGSEICDRC